jgi:hypothetical protein
MALGTMGPARLPVSQRPQPGPLRYGLFNVAPPQTLQNVTDENGNVDNIADHAYGGGLVYDPVGCGTAFNSEIDCAPVNKTFSENTPEVEVLPWNVYASLVCGTYGYTPAYLEQKVNTRLFANEQEAVEEAFWTGSAGNLPRLDDPAGATDVGGGGTFANIVDAVAALEAFAYANYGYHAVLHANTAVAAYASADNLVWSATEFGPVWGTSSNDPTLRTQLGTKWVFGGGYPGTSPDGLAPGAGETYIWITGNVAVWRQPTFTPSLWETFDRNLNQWQVLSERGYLATYDCFHAYALVDIPNPAVP